MGKIVDLVVGILCLLALICLGAGVIMFLYDAFITGHIVSGLLVAAFTLFCSAIFIAIFSN